MYEKLTKCPNFTRFLPPKNYQSNRFFYDICPKINNIPRILHDFCPKMTEFYVTVARKIFSRILGSTCPPPLYPPSPTPMSECILLILWRCFSRSWSTRTLKTRRPIRCWLWPVISAERSVWYSAVPYSRSVNSPTSSSCSPSPGSKFERPRADQIVSPISDHSRESFSSMFWSAVGQSINQLSNQALPGVPDGVRPPNAMRWILEQNGASLGKKYW